MNFTDLSIPDIYGVDRVSINGNYTESTLSERLIKEWIPYFECHKCGRWDYCKFAKRHPANPNRSVDIKCGVASDCLRNLVKFAYPTLRKMNRGQLQDFLDGAYCFYKFIYESEQYIGMNMDDSFHSYWGDFAPMIYSRVGHLRGHLNGLASHWKNLPGFSAKSPVIFVEGYSEKAFIDELKKSHLAWFLHLSIEVYGGNGNRVPKRIQMLLDKLKAQGLVVYAQGDADGKSTDIFRGLIRGGVLDEDKVFVFDHDFETSIPHELLFAALQEMTLLHDMSKESFLRQLGSFTGSVVARLKQQFQIDLDPHKIELATTVAGLLNEIIWWKDESFTSETELGRFISFIQRVL